MITEEEALLKYPNTLKSLPTTGTFIESYLVDGKMVSVIRGGDTDGYYHLHAGVTGQGHLDDKST